MSHQALKAQASIFGIDLAKLYADLAAEFVKDETATAAALLGIVEAALSGASQPKQATAGPLSGLLAQLWAALQANGPAAVSLILQLVLSVLAKQPTP